MSSDRFQVSRVDNTNEQSNNQPSNGIFHSFNTELPLNPSQLNARKSSRALSSDDRCRKFSLAQLTR